MLTSACQSLRRDTVLNYPVGYLQPSSHGVDQPTRSFEACSAIKITTSELTELEGETKPFARPFTAALVLQFHKRTTETHISWTPCELFKILRGSGRATPQTSTAYTPSPTASLDGSRRSVPSQDRRDRLSSGAVLFVKSSWGAPEQVVKEGKDWHPGYTLCM